MKFTFWLTRFLLAPANKVHCLSSKLEFKERTFYLIFLAQKKEIISQKFDMVSTNTIELENLDNHLKGTTSTRRTRQFSDNRKLLIFFQKKYVIFKFLNHLKMIVK